MCRKSSKPILKKRIGWASRLCASSTVAESECNENRACRAGSHPVRPLLPGRAPRSRRLGSHYRDAALTAGPSRPRGPTTGALNRPVSPLLPGEYSGGGNGKTWGHVRWPPDRHGRRTAHPLGDRFADHAAHQEADRRPAAKDRHGGRLSSTTENPHGGLSHLIDPAKLITAGLLRAQLLGRFEERPCGLVALLGIAQSNLGGGSLSVCYLTQVTQRALLAAEFGQEDGSAVQRDSVRKVQRSTVGQRRRRAQDKKQYRSQPQLPGMACYEKDG